MNAGDDFSLKRDIKLGFLVFLQSECIRHNDDIGFISRIMDKVCNEIKATDAEKQSITEMAERYRKI